MTSRLVLAQKIAQSALDLGAVQFSEDKPFKWASGFYMPVYNDNRLLLSDASLRKTIVEAMQLLLKEQNIQPNCIGGVPTAGLPWATSLADAMELPLI